MREFVERNWADIGKAGFLVLVCLLLLLYYAAIPKKPEPVKSGAGELTETVSTPFGNLEVKKPNETCTLFFNKSLNATFAYRVTMKSPGGAVVMDSGQDFLGADQASGLAVTRSYFKTTEATMAIYEYFDSRTQACAKIVLESSRAGEQKTQNTVGCDKAPEGNIFGRLCIEKMVPVGTENIVTGAGSFRATVYNYTGENMTYWIADGVSVPLKYDADYISAELVKFEA